MQASVVICAVGRNRLLPWVIHGAVKQTVPAEDYEVIVVEGEGAGRPGSAPGESDIWEMVSTQALISPVNIRYLYVPNPRPGSLLQAARRVAHGASMVLLPTDQVVGDDWLAGVLYGNAAASVRFAE